MGYKPRRDEPIGLKQMWITLVVYVSWQIDTVNEQQQQKIEWIKNIRLRNLVKIETYIIGLM